MKLVPAPIAEVADHMVIIAEVGHMVAVIEVVDTGEADSEDINYT